MWPKVYEQLPITAKPYILAEHPIPNPWVFVWSWSSLADVLHQPPLF